MLLKGGLSPDWSGGAAVLHLLQNGAEAEPRKAGCGRRMCSKKAKKNSENNFDWN